ncbi:hypothetical protein [Dyadobacter frigoris]|uniref:Uncharacterized protein n=1 Tax=Dyadobacter frigoris TaxID=2576211 RepID=A0A4U6CYP9_9BACT|nr:hypothetical protein [Dyadobacter frigoris]TKT89496.1 hypothetical protein FDK13_24445 [Dyadobacter frigoris]
MNKLVINLTPQETKILAEILGLILTGSDVHALKIQLMHGKMDYLLFSCVHDLYNRLDSKTKEIQAFGHKPGKSVKVFLKRHEALALFMLFNDAKPENESHLPAIPDHTMNMIRTMRGEIHKHYLV